LAVQPAPAGLAAILIVASAAAAECEVGEEGDESEKGDRNAPWHGEFHSCHVSGNIGSAEAGNQ
jgi:hypothetical protein